MVRSIDPITADENVAFYGNTLFASSAVSLVIGMVFDAHVRGMKQKDAYERKGQGFRHNLQKSQLSYSTALDQKTTIIGTNSVYSKDVS